MKARPLGTAAAFKQYFGKSPSEFKKMLPSFQEFLDSFRQNWAQMNHWTDKKANSTWQEIVQTEERRL